MFKNYIKIAWRNINKYRTTTTINIFGLTVGLSVAFLIGIYVLNEWQTDRGLPEADRTFRLLRASSINNEPYDIGVTSAPFAPALLQDFSAEIESTLRVLNGSSLVSKDNQQFQEDDYYYVDPNFLTFFDFKLLHGDAATALTQPNSLVLTATTAEKYFGSASEAMGKTLRIDNDYDVQVMGVVEDIPYPTHLDFDMLESTLSLEEANWWSGWWNNSLITYVRLKPDASAMAVESHFPQFMDKYFGDDFKRNNSRIDLKLEPIRATYFAAATRYDPIVHGNFSAVRIFAIAALLLVFIACANYVNMATAKAAKRSRNVAIFRVLGSGKRQIVAQALGESFLISFFAILLAVVIAYFSLPRFGQLMEIDFNLNFSWGQLALGLTALIIGLTLLSGWYPGWLLSTFQPVKVLSSSKNNSEGQTANIRKLLVVFQFALSIGLIGGTFIIQQQLQYLQKKDLGFDRENVLTIRANNPDLYPQRHLLRSQLEQLSSVRSIASVSGLPGGFHDATILEIEGQTENIRTRTAFVDFDYIETLDIQLISGRNFSKELASDSTRAVLLNERAVSEMLMTPESVLGTQIQIPMYDSLEKTVIGVVKDYHFSSLHGDIEPLLISPSFSSSLLAIKLEDANTAETIATTEQFWSELSPAFPFTYEFMDEHLAELYDSETRQGQLFSLFAIVAILIACFGMFGLAAHAASARVKEIGIRKVLGASVSSIIALLSKDFLRLVFIAFIVATPLLWYLMRNWLSDFAYRIEMQWWMFALAGIAAIGIALLTVSFQSVKAALANPVESLRKE